MLRIENLTYRIGPRVLLDQASAVINPGHRVGMVGRNGTGKTTLLRLITGGLDPDGGACAIKKPGADTFEGFDMPDEDAQRAISLAEEMDDFAAAIQEGRKPEVAGEEGMAAVAVMEAIVRSAESGAPVEVGSL